jgi:hypothetical protein
MNKKERREWAQRLATQIQRDAMLRQGSSVDTITQALAQAEAIGGNYTADDAVEPRRVDFENGRFVEWTPAGLTIGLAGKE